jgi:hypothetical protein
VKGPLPEAVIVPAPFVFPLQRTSVVDCTEVVGPPEDVTVVIAVVVQPLASVIVQV